MRCVIHHSFSTQLLSYISVIHPCLIFLLQQISQLRNLFILAIEFSDVTLSRFTWVSLKECREGKVWGHFWWLFGKIIWMCLSALTCYKFPYNKLGHLYLSCGLATVSTVALKLVRWPMFACVLPAIAARYYNRGVIRKTC